MIWNALPWAIASYLLLGLVFSFFFLARGMRKLDPETKGTGFGFHLLMLPGAVAFWPFLIAKWLKA